ncbi:hypothetical protein PSEUDO8AS_20116 [Pseudomonas sp. 8AS]|nr:hypothetical protein PSEUDO8AS_20116 [Pseudomonas sp. 8AS]
MLRLMKRLTDSRRACSSPPADCRSSCCQLLRRASRRASARAVGARLPSAWPGAPARHSSRPLAQSNRRRRAGAPRRGCSGMVAGALPAYWLAGVAAVYRYAAMLSTRVRQRLGPRCDAGRLLHKISPANRRTVTHKRTTPARGRGCLLQARFTSRAAC